MHWLNRTKTSKIFTLTLLTIAAISVSTFDSAKTKVWLIPTNEEVMLARDAYKDLLNA